MSVQAISWALGQQRVTAASARHVLLCLANYAGEDGRNAFPSIARLCADTGLSERAVRNNLRDLEEAGVIERGNQAVAAAFIDRADRRPTVYDIRIDDEERGAGNAAREATGGISFQNGGHLTTERGAGDAPEPSYNHQLNRQKDSSLPLGDPVEADFGEWYALYPHKVGRGAALKAYRSARKKTGKSELLEAVKRYAAATARAGTEKRFIPHPSTWLNGERWADEAPAPQANSHAGVIQQSRPGEYQARDPADFDLDDWTVRIRLYRQNGKWAETWGPRPPAEGDIADLARTYLQRHRRAA